MHRKNTLSNQQIAPRNVMVSWLRSTAQHSEEHSEHHRRSGYPRVRQGNEMREDQVENGVNFLTHPKAKAAPLSQRISFLENKVYIALEGILKALASQTWKRS